MRKRLGAVALGSAAGLLVFLGITAAQGDPVGLDTVVRGLVVALVATGAAVFYVQRHHAPD